MDNRGHLAPKGVRKKLTAKTPGKRCGCGNLCAEGHYECKLCVVTKRRKKRKASNAKTHDEIVKLRRVK